MSDPWTIKRGDTEPPFIATVAGYGIPPLPAGATVMFHLRSLPTGAVVVNAAMTITDAGGERQTVRYDWQPGDTDTAGGYLAEVEARWSDVDGDHVATFPSGGSVAVSIVEDIA